MISVLAFFNPREDIFVAVGLMETPVKAKVLHNSERGKQERNEDTHHYLVSLQLFPLLQQTQCSTASLSAMLRKQLCPSV